MALEEKDFLGSAKPHDGITIGFVPQEPRLTPGKTVRENIEEAVEPTRALLRQHEDLGNKVADAAADEFDSLMEKMSRVQDKIDATNAWELDRQLEIAMDAMRLP